MDTREWTGLCTACGEVWDQDERPSACPECGFAGVVTILSKDPAAIALRKRHGEMG